MATDATRDSRLANARGRVATARRWLVAASAGAFALTFWLARTGDQPATPGTATTPAVQPAAGSSDDFFSGGSDLGSSSSSGPGLDQGSFPQARTGVS